MAVVAAEGVSVPNVQDIMLEDYPIDYVLRKDLGSIWISKRDFLKENYKLAEEKVKKIIGEILPLYSVYGGLKYANECGPNAKYIFNYYKGKYDVKILYICDNTISHNKMNNVLASRKLFFGPVGLTMGCTSYHAFPFFSDEGIYFAIETTICTPTIKLQFIFGKSEEEVLDVITNRYKMKKLKLTTNSTKNWYEFLMYGGGKKKTVRNKTRTHRIQRKRRLTLRRNHPRTNLTPPAT
jgi:hypothetical protein